LIYATWAFLLFTAVFFSAVSGYPLENRLLGRVWNFAFNVASAVFGLFLGVSIALRFAGQLPNNYPFILILVLTLAPGIIGVMLAEWYHRQVKHDEKEKPAGE
jgi:purine-cytosine permease-like protein